MHRFAYRAAISGAAAVPIALLLAGCSSSSGGGGGAYGGGGGSSPSSVAPATSAAAGAPAGSQSSSAKAGTPVTATEQEFSITLSKQTFKPGTYTFTVHNVGHFQHNLTIEGPGIDKTASPTVPGGGTGTLTVTLQKGSYELWCSVDSHKDKGMDLNVTVS